MKENLKGNLHSIDYVLSAVLILFMTFELKFDKIKSEISWQIKILFYSYGKMKDKPITTYSVVTAHKLDSIS